MPGTPGAVELADVGQAVVTARGGIPAGAAAVADELEEARASAHLDQEARDGIAMAVEAHQVARVFLDPEQAGERQVAPAGEQVDGDPVMSPSLLLVLAEQRG